MVQVLYSGETRELEISGTRRELLALGRLLRGKSGSCDLLENRQPFPYERSLSKIEFREEPERNTASLVTEDQAMRIQGGRAALDLLADNIEGFASGVDSSGHCHVDFPAHEYVAPESDSLVITFTK
ncbi:MULTISPECIES: hypothetical protein [unclassified Streptomyces]|uniref:Imm32 family immunity protein n=1 Tax=unclassified Streptomyces TaxID=2593676 RepID=UPI00382E4EF1